MQNPTHTIIQTPDPPYYAVIFSSKRTQGDRGYAEMAVRMEELAKAMPGFLGIESVRNSTGMGITVSYWQTEQDILRWKQNAEHLDAQEGGKSKWYADYSIRVAKVERAYGKQNSMRAPIH